MGRGETLVEKQSDSHGKRLLFGVLRTLEHTEARTAEYVWIVRWGVEQLLNGIERPLRRERLMGGIILFHPTFILTSRDSASESALTPAAGRENSQGLNVGWKCLRMWSVGSGNTPSSNKLLDFGSKLLLAALTKCPRKSSITKRCFDHYRDPCLDYE